MYVSKVSYKVCYKIYVILRRLQIYIVEIKKFIILECQKYINIFNFKIIMEIVVVNNYVYVIDLYCERDFKIKEIGGLDVFWKYER